MKRLSILILALAFFSLVPLAQAATPDYAALKADYIKNHPGQALLPFPWEPITSTRVLPFNYAIPAAPGNSISITACRDQFESASFIVNAQKDLPKISLSIPDLQDAQGNSIPADAINVRTVKVWYQASADDIWTGGINGYYLTPELLLKDDTLVKVDYTNRINYLKVTINGVEQYIDISTPTATFPSNAQIHDTPTLQPFSLKANENKQIWVTVHVPSTTPAGEYTGDLILTTPSENPVTMTLTVTVLPFELEPTPLEYSIYYDGTLPSTTGEDILVGKFSSDFKTAEQLSAELKDIKDHGVLYPTLHQEYHPTYTRYYTNFATVMSLRKQAGLPNDHIYSRAFETNDQDIANKATQLKQITSQYGYQDVYIYGIDEARGNVLLSERPAWQTVHATGAKVFVAVDNNIDAVNVVGDLLDVANFYGPLNTTQAAKWHSQGQRIFSYGNPQVGVENPEIYRTNYGFTLWNAGYDGAMNWKYQGYFNNIWNDFDSTNTNYRDAVFAYPTSNGVIDTIQWEGWRTAVDDTRYLASLMKQEGSDTSARAIVSGSLSNGKSMATIRNSVINQILSSQTPTPTPTKTLTANERLIRIYQKGIWYLDFWGTKLEKMRFW